MSEHIKKAFDHVAQMDRIRATLKERSEYWPEVLESISEEDGKGYVEVYLSTLERYKHEGKWYTRHHIERGLSTMKGVDSYLVTAYRRLLTQVHFSAQIGQYYDRDDEDPCQLDEEARLKFRFKFLDRKTNEDSDVT